MALRSEVSGDPVAGEYEVTFELLGSDGKVDPFPMNIPIGDHGNIYRVLSAPRDSAWRPGDLVEALDPPAEHAVEIAERRPVVSQAVPYVGELTDTELRWLTGLPGKAFNAHWRFTVTPVEQPAPEPADEEAPAVAAPAATA